MQIGRQMVLGCALAALLGFLLEGCGGTRDETAFDNTRQAHMKTCSDEKGVKDCIDWYLENHPNHTECGRGLRNICETDRGCAIDSTTYDGCMPEAVPEEVEPEPSSEL